MARDCGVGYCCFVARNSGVGLGYGAMLNADLVYFHLAAVMVGIMVCTRNGCNGEISFRYFLNPPL